MDIMRPNVQVNLFTKPRKSYIYFSKLLYQPLPETSWTNFQAMKEQVDLLHFAQTLFVLLVSQIWGSYCISGSSEHELQVYIY